MNMASTGPIVYPPPLRPGDTIAVTAPSAPVRIEHEGRLDFVVDWLRGGGYEVVEGRCLRGEGHVSAPARERAEEFNAPGNVLVNGAEAHVVFSGDERRIVQTLA